jgi:flagella basal body P-ring formation protein FlgA
MPGRSAPESIVPQLLSKTWLVLALWCLAGSVAAAGAAGSITAPAAIREAAIAALGGDPAQAEASVDPNLRMAACAAPLQAVPTSARVVQVRCPDRPGWHLYVPVQVRDVKEVVVLTGPVQAGETITADMLAVRRRDMAGEGAGGFADPAALVGQTAHRSLAPGAAVTRADVAGERLLRRGDPVVLVSRAGGIEVRVAGRALGQAAPGGAISVENTQSRQIVRGRVVGDGLVEVMR